METLTQRQRQIVEVRQQGVSDIEELAKRLDVGIATMMIHLKMIRLKLGREGWRQIKDRSGADCS